MKEIIYHTTLTNFCFSDRVKILLGCNLEVRSEMECKNESVTIENTTTKARIVLPSWLQKIKNKLIKRKGGGLSVRESEKTIQHIAGELIDGIQCCVVCGEELCNYQNAVSPGSYNPKGFYARAGICEGQSKDNAHR